jgi:hypothetical protein
MSVAFDAERHGRHGSLPRAPASAFERRAPASGAAPSGPLASQARAIRRHTARRDEQAVAAWLRELASRNR